MQIQATPVKYNINFIIKTLYMIFSCLYVELFAFSAIGLCSSVQLIEV